MMPSLIEQQCEVHAAKLAIIDGQPTCLLCWADSQLDREARQAEVIKKTRAILDKMYAQKTHPLDGNPS